MKIPIWIFLLASLLYGQTLSYDYVLDDSLVLSENVFTQKGLQGIPGIWTHDTFYGFFQSEEKANLVSGGRYRPFTLTLFAIEGEIFGFDPWVGHFFNCLYYGILCMLIYLLLYQLTLRLKKSYHRVALWATLFFTTHPLHSEVVANIKGRDEILALLGGVLTIWIIKKSTRPLMLTLAFLSFSMALFSKENALVFVLLVPLYFILVHNKRAAWLSLLPLLTASALYIMIRSIVLGDVFTAGAPTELMNNPFMVWEENSYRPLGFFERLPTVFLGLGYYLKLFVLPWPLTHDYYPLQIPIVGFGNAWAWLSFTIYLTLTGTALAYFIRKKRLAAYAWIWFVVALFPMSNILVNVGTLLSERFLFIPSLGLSLLWALGIFHWKIKKYKLPKFRTAVGVAIVGVYVLLTLIRTPAWKTNYDLFTTDVVVSDRSAKAHNAAAGELNAKAGIATQEVERQPWANKAEGHARKAIELHPTFKNAYLQLGNAYFYQNEYESAIQNYKIALQLDPDYPDALNNLGLAYRDAGQYYGEKKQEIDKALRYLEQAYELRPNDYETVRLLGVANGVAGHAHRAVNFFKKALSMRPENRQANHNLGVALIQTGKIDSGQYYIEKAKTIDPSENPKE